MASTRCACICDFDLTLSEEYQQMPILRKYAAQLLKKHGVTPEQYLTKICGTDVTNAGVRSMQQLIFDAQDIFPWLTEQVMREEFGPQIRLARGLPEWLPRITQFSEGLDLELRHYVVSAGCTALITGTAIADYLTPPIYAGEFEEDSGRITKIKRAIDPYSKTMWIKKICKGKDLDADLALHEYDVNYDHVVLFADGFTDRDAINFIRERGGYTIGVYNEQDPGDFEKAKRMLAGKVHFLVPRDYSSGSPLEQVVHQALDKISHKQCDYYYMLTDALPLNHIGNSSLRELTSTHLADCPDCQYRGRQTEIHPPRT